MRTTFTTLLILNLIYISGCTTRVASTRYISENFCHTIKGKKHCTTPIGVAYNLPAKELTYTLTLELADCATKPIINVISAAASDTIVKDPFHRYHINTDNMIAFNKAVTEGKISLTNGILTAVNYEAHDKTIQIVKEVTKFIAGFQLGFPGIAKAGPPLDDDETVCNKRTTEAIAKRNNPPAPTKKTNQQQDNQSGKNDPAPISLTVTQNNIQGSSTKNKNNGSGNNQLQLSIAAKVLPLREHAIKTKDGYVYPLEINHAPFLKWLKSDHPHLTSILKEITDEIQLDIILSQCGDGTFIDVNTDKKPGLYYRQPNQCRADLLWKGLTFISQRTDIPQFGLLMRHNIENRIFQSHTTTVTFDDNGGTTEYKVVQENSPALQAITELNSIQEETLNHQKSIITAQKELLEEKQNLEKQINSN